MGVRLVVRSADGQAPDEDIGYVFDQTRVVIGRAPSADVRIPHLSVSARHALLLPTEDGYAIEDSESTNGTQVNGADLLPGRRRRLNNGDVIRIGTYEIGYQSGVLVAQTTTAERTAELARRLFRRAQRDRKHAQPRVVVVVAGDGVGQSLAIPDPPARLRVGSSDACQLVLRDPEVALEHVELSRDLDGVSAQALDGAHVEVSSPQHATQPLAAQLTATRRLRDGDELKLGSTKLLFEEPADESLRALDTQDDIRLPKAPAADRPRADAAQPMSAATEALPRKGKSQSKGKGKGKRLAGKAKAQTFDADVIIYALAAIVMLVSIAGLIVLLGD